MEGKGQSVCPRRLGSKGTVELGWLAPLTPTSHSLSRSSPPDGSRSAGHAGPFTEPCPAARSVPADRRPHCPSQQVLTAWLCVQKLGFSILMWRLSTRLCASTLACRVELRFCMMLENVGRGVSRPRPLRLSGPPEKLFVTS